MIIPIRTETEIRRTPIANYGIILLNVFCFMLSNTNAVPMDFLALRSDEPAFYQFFSYQFLHADAWHLLGNMLFLWVFGNALNSKMRDLPFLLFYLAGGAFAGWGFAVVTPEAAHLVGASGAIAAVTTAFLVLFPRSRVTVLIWLFIFIHIIEVPALLMIGLKIIVWDNIIAPGLGQSSNVAISAHLAGYLFGFSTSLFLLLIRALPRDQFDIIALWKRWHQRREFASAMPAPGAAAKARFGAAAREEPADAKQRGEEEKQLDEVNAIRSSITEKISAGDLPAATILYEELIGVDDKQCLSERNQLDVAREFYSNGRASQAAAAFERFVDCYPHSTEVGNMRLLLGIIYARDLREYETAAVHLTQSLALLRDPDRRNQCSKWLETVYGALGRPAPEL